MKHWLLFFLFLAAGWPACKSTAPFPMHQKSWRLVELKYKHPPSNVAISLQFDAGAKRFNGNNSCNAYHGAYTLEGSTLKFGPAVSTKKYCAELADWESAYMNMLATVDNYVYRDNQLRLFVGTKVVAVFE